MLVSRRIGEPAANRALRALVEFPEERVLPRVPELRVSAAHIGDRMQVEMIEVLNVADDFREFIDDVRIVDVLLLRSQRQEQMVLD